MKHPIRYALLCACVLSCLGDSVFGQLDLCGLTWRRVTVPNSANSPGELIGQAFAYDARRGRAVLFGGSNPLTGIRSTAETWEWNGISWTQRTPPIQPAARREAAMVYDSDRGVCVLFGGGTNTFQHEIPFNDTWEWDGATWTQRQSNDPLATDRPPPTDYPVMAYDSVRKRTVLLGSSQRTDGGIHPVSQTWEWDGSGWTAFASVPPARFGSAIAFDAVRGETVLFGGSANPGGYLNDTWRWTGATWSLASPGGPPGRNEHALAFDVRRQVLVLFGGSNGSTVDLLEDTWEWNGGSWSQIPGAGAFGLIGRRLHAMWYETGEQRLMVFGGTFSARTANGGFIHTILDDLFEARPPGRWVDFNYPGLPSVPETGWFHQPYNTLIEAVNAANAGCTLMLKAGAWAGSITITKPLHLEAFTSPVTIGQ